VDGITPTYCIAAILFGKALELPAISLRRFVLAPPAVRRPEDAPIPLGNM
jgi:hypothetical protein